MDDFYNQVRRFNEMYNLGYSSVPMPVTDSSIQLFKQIIAEEVEEADEILTTQSHIDRLTAMADWLGDLIVYCHTKADQIGLPMAEILQIIMESNFSKLDANGQPIYDERGKVLKGPNYWKPEPEIKKLLIKHLSASL